MCSSAPRPSSFGLSIAFASRVKDALHESILVVQDIQDLIASKRNERSLEHLNVSAMVSRQLEEVGRVLHGLACSVRLPQHVTPTSTGMTGDRQRAAAPVVAASMEGRSQEGKQPEVTRSGLAYGTWRTGAERCLGMSGALAQSRYLWPMAAEGTTSALLTALLPRSVCLAVTCCKFCRCSL